MLKLWSKNDVTRLVHRLFIDDILSGHFVWRNSIPNSYVQLGPNASNIGRIIFFVYEPKNVKNFEPTLAPDHHIPNLNLSNNTDDEASLVKLKDEFDDTKLRHLKSYIERFKKAIDEISILNQISV